MANSEVVNIKQEISQKVKELNELTEKHKDEMFISFKINSASNSEIIDNYYLKV
jgi:hypothetical protein